MTAATETDRLVSLRIPEIVAAKLDDMAIRHGLPIEQMVRYLLWNVATLADALPTGMRRAIRAARSDQDVQ